MQRADEWLLAFALALAIPATERRETLDRLCTTLAGRCALLVLDNCDRIAAGAGDLVFALLRGTDELKVLMTSQAPLNFVGEHLMRMPPLALPDRQQERR